MMYHTIVGKPVLHSVAAGIGPVIEVLAVHDCPNDLIAIGKAGHGPKGEFSIRAVQTCEILAHKFLKVIATHD